MRIGTHFRNSKSVQITTLMGGVSDFIHYARFQLQRFVADDAGEAEHLTPRVIPDYSRPCIGWFREGLPHA